ncbi:hypothetical protein BVW01_03435 [Mycobacterium tuberculosis]|nr:hypothetical protein BVW01_03435 [Mycobacterium tuberculosis]
MEDRKDDRKMSTPTLPDMVAPSPRVRVKDRCRRMMGDLRLSVIDQCNLRCRYCMPEEHYTWLPRQARGGMDADRLRTALGL